MRMAVDGGHATFKPFIGEHGLIEAFSNIPAFEHQIITACDISVQSNNRDSTSHTGI